MPDPIPTHVISSVVVSLSVSSTHPNPKLLKDAKALGTKDQHRMNHVQYDLGTSGKSPLPSIKEETSH